MMAGKGTKVQLNCGCYDNWGRANYANYKAGVSFQHTSDGKKQNSKNKMKLPFCCKHLHAFSFKLLQEKMLNTDLTLAPEVLRVAKNTIAQLEAKKRKSQKKWTDTFEELFTGTPQKVSASTKLKPDTK
jgi:hypothetical protein